MALLTYISIEEFLEESPTLNHSSRIYPESPNAWAARDLGLSSGVQRTVPIQIITEDPLYIKVTINNINYFVEA